MFASGPAFADDKVDFTTTWFQEARSGGQGGLTVIHPQFDFGVDIGEHFSLGGGYSADVVTGATASIYSPDAVSSATKFDDVRHDGRITLGLAGSRSALSATFGAATERDYASISVSVSGNIDLPGKNTNLALGYTHNFDEVCDKDNAELTPLEREALTGFDNCSKDVLFGKDTPGETVWRDLTIDTFQGTVTQNFTPTIIGQLALFGQVIDGFQSNPYRRVSISCIGPMNCSVPQEAVPDTRARISVTGRIKKFIKPLRAAIQFSARGYSDTWGVHSATVGMTWSQYIGRTLLLRFRGRIYQQSEASFFKDAWAYETGGPAGAYFTGDRELGRIRNMIGGAKLSYITSGKNNKQVWGLFDELRFNLKGDFMALGNLRADAPDASARSIDDQFINGPAFVLQIGLLLKY